MHESLNVLLKLILPEVIEEYFELTETKNDRDIIHLYLKELNRTLQLISKGLFEEVTTQDFSIRGFKVFCI